jgi:UDP:flavonoid glycosyltransferase YjiC (YdhE family)
VSPRCRILFVAENVTLAQCVRLVTLARSLDETSYEVHFACSDFPQLVFGGTRFVQHQLASLSPEAAAKALEAGQRLYEKKTLLRYIEADRALIAKVQPALVVGDFRLSISTSAALMRVPSAVLINAYWSPFERRQDFPVPDHPIIKWLGEELTEKYFPRAIPHVFRHFASPVNAARAHHGLAPIGGLLEVLSHADYTLYPDDPSLFSLDGAPSNHLFLGPVLWQPELDEAGSSGAGGAADEPLAHWLNGPEPLIYVTLGSSGALGLLPRVIEALGRLPVRGVVSTAGRVELGELPPNVLARRFVRGADVARRAALVVSNGGSTTGYQALSQGAPVLGLPSNFDQFLAMQAIERAGAGLTLKARQADVASIHSALLQALADAKLAEAARVVSESFARRDSGEVFRGFVARATGSSAPSPRYTRPSATA